jgi:hypothetical protein
VLLPFLVAGHAAGYEIIHPMAVVVLGGFFTAAVVNLFVVPPLYVLFGPTPKPQVTVDLTAPTFDAAEDNGQSDAKKATTTNA